MFFFNQPTVHGWGVSRGRVCRCDSWRSKYRYIGILTKLPYISYHLLQYSKNYTESLYDFFRTWIDIPETTKFHTSPDHDACDI